MDKVVQERNRIVTELIEKSNLHEEEKLKITAELQEKEEELAGAQKELGQMNKRLFMERMERKRNSKSVIDFNSAAIDFTRSHVLRKVGLELILKAPRSLVAKKFNSLANELPKEYINDLEREGFFDSGLTIEGYRMLKTLAERELALS